LAAVAQPTQTVQIVFLALSLRQVAAKAVLMLPKAQATAVQVAVAAVTTF
jgi:hypothetical protein